MPRPPLDAVTALLVHDDELLMVQRHPALTVFPGYHAFPGGKVDPEDARERPDHPHFQSFEPALINALVRELQEEIAFDLAVAAQAGHVTGIHALGEFTAPKWVPRRFRTRFFRIELNTRPALTPCGQEIVGAEWQPVAEWMERFERGRLLLAPPTKIAVEALHGERELYALPGIPDDLEREDAVAWIEPVGGLRLLPVLSNTLPPAHHTNAFWFGDAGARRVLVDPSPANREELGRLLRRVEPWGVDLVFLTHHHPDHREFADEVARHFDVPIGMSADTWQRISEKTNGAFFAGLEVLKFADGDELTRWQGEAVRTIAVPGHDEGQLAPMSDSRAWCIVGDLIQGVGTVVISPPEGNMRKYFATLEKMIELDPAVIIPSHGMALGTAHYLQAALEHRRKREAEILALHEAGKTEDEILAIVYAGVDERLLGLARVNIKGHFDKLREDQCT